MYKCVDPQCSFSFKGIKSINSCPECGKLIYEEIDNSGHRDHVPYIRLSEGSAMSKLVMVKIARDGAGRICGQISCGLGVQSFLDLGDFVLSLSDMCGHEGDGAYIEASSNDPASYKDIAEWVYGGGPYVTFWVRVLFHQNSSIQGQVRFSNSIHTANFKSALDLIRLIDAELKCKAINQ